MESFILEQLTSGGVVGLCIGGFAWLFRYVLKRNEYREEKLEKEIERGVEREHGYQGVIRDNQEIMKQQAESLRDVSEIKAILKMKVNTEERVETH
ncbi:hypothetical protein [Bacillus sp. COPE52]|uniref:hypothetical protein n=1 Tax=Bacillus sp. COPE52 TaxID=2233998 RepID=UPI000E10BD4C|nr:hypothetical protein [Bacillus sp. COPE52]AXK19118.1 hypothetical protein DPQ31_16030 [Bacillus sp. COPE52]